MLCCGAWGLYVHRGMIPQAQSLEEVNGKNMEKNTQIKDTVDHSPCDYPSTVSLKL
jgi:hypothetical protein